MGTATRIERSYRGALLPEREGVILTDLPDFNTTPQEHLQVYHGDPGDEIIATEGFGPTPHGWVVIYVQTSPFPTCITLNRELRPSPISPLALMED